MAISKIVQDSINSDVTTTGPSFSAYYNGDTTISSSTWTKLPINTEEWDTNSCYDTTNYRFTPNVAGYYFVEGSFYPYSGAGCSRAICYIWKNGDGHKAGNYIPTFQGVQAIAVVSSMVYMNGTTDYIELYGLATGTSLRFEGISGATIEMHFSAFLARKA